MYQTRRTLTVPSRPEVKEVRASIQVCGCRATHGCERGASYSPARRAGSGAIGSGARRPVNSSPAFVGISTAIAAGTLVLFIITTIVAGAGQGIAISAATRGLLHGSTLAERAPIFSAIYLLCYSGAAFPSLISGQLSNVLSLPQIVLGYSGLAIVATLLTVLGARNPHTDTTGNSTRDSSNATGSPIHGTAS